MKSRVGKDLKCRVFGGKILFQNEIFVVLNNVKPYHG